MIWGRILSCLFQLLVTLGIPWFVAAKKSLPHLYMTFFIVHLCYFLFFSYKDV